jgi:hypothetical protein
VTVTFAPTFGPNAMPPPTAPPAFAASGAGSAPGGDLLNSSDKEGDWALYQVRPDGSAEEEGVVDDLDEPD